MRKKRIEEVEEVVEDEIVEETAEEPQKDLKLGEFELRPGAVLLVKKTKYKGEDRIDFRVWTNTAKYKGPTKQGFVLTMDKIDEFINFVSGLKEKLGTVEKPSGKKKKKKSEQ